MTATVLPKRKAEAQLKSRASPNYFSISLSCLRGLQPRKLVLLLLLPGQAPVELAAFAEA